MLEHLRFKIKMQSNVLKNFKFKNNLNVWSKFPNKTRDVHMSYMSKLANQLNPIGYQDHCDGEHELFWLPQQ